MFVSEMGVQSSVSVGYLYFFFIEWFGFFSSGLNFHYAFLVGFLKFEACFFPVYPYVCRFEINGNEFVLVWSLWLDKLNYKWNIFSFWYGRSSHAWKFKFKRSRKFPSLKFLSHTHSCDSQHTYLHKYIYTPFFLFFYFVFCFLFFFLSENHTQACNDVTLMIKWVI